jgi:hypothetical protein
MPEQLKALSEAMKPYVEQARSTFPAAKARYLAGLKNGEVLFVTARIYDERTWSELAIIRVTGIQGYIIEGRVWSKPKLVNTHGFRDRFAFPENLLMDWSITSPDGAEEGNLLGKSLSLPIKPPQPEAR